MKSEKKTLAYHITSSGGFSDERSDQKKKQNKKKKPENSLLPNKEVFLLQPCVVLLWLVLSVRKAVQFIGCWNLFLNQKWKQTLCTSTSDSQQCSTLFHRLFGNFSTFDFAKNHKLNTGARRFKTINSLESTRHETGQWGNCFTILCKSCACQVKRNWPTIRYLTWSPGECDK